MSETRYHLRDRHLGLLHPFPCASRQDAERFRDSLGCDDEIVEVPVRVLGDNEAEEAELDLQIERQIETEANKYPEAYDETR